MDGAPYLRKVNLRNYSAYEELSSALENMFSCFTIGSNSDVFIRSYCYFSVMSAQYGSPGAPEKEMLNESKLKDFFMDLNTYSRMRIRMGPGCLSMMSPGCAPSPNPSACSSHVTIIQEEEEEKNLKLVQLHR
ncbi:hypothetical protein P3L10_008174 [Capsicum annuum]|uniref:uncharacterized protein LOC107864751 n=1 Tax=Capsicum annuum TaxID=4072 RepID=UPI0007BEBD8D|nr:uncharacterized protein LOC107864751 [Capsicum annuum]